MEAIGLLRSSMIPLLRSVVGQGVDLSAAGVPVLAGLEGRSNRINQQQQFGQQIANCPLEENKSGKLPTNSVGLQFKQQLNELMEKVYTTKPHYIRCLKPNDDNVCDQLNRSRIVEQLRYGGVLEAVKVARSGFPVRLSHTDFYTRYRPIANPFLVAGSGGLRPKLVPTGSAGPSAETSADKTTTSTAPAMRAPLPRTIGNEHVNNPEKYKAFLNRLVEALIDTSITKPGTSKARQAGYTVYLI